MGIWVLADELDHLSLAFGRLLVFTASLIDHAEAVPAVGLVGESSQEIAGRDLCGVELGRADEIDDGIGCIHQLFVALQIVFGDACGDGRFQLVDSWQMRDGAQRAPRRVLGEFLARLCGTELRQGRGLVLG